MFKARIGTEGGRPRPASGAGGAVIIRVLIAVFGGYAVAALAAACLARVLPIEPEQASVTGQMLSFLIYAAAVIYAFAAKRLARLALELALAMAVLSAILGLSLFVGGGA